ncbi:MAG TPA: adenylate/guanylate cyclase domain-containing protein [Smithellaceae bacterium]|nr:adenylate/guanylate cyclase domain-containing protein [Smithellaceae bacterium]HPE06591.1 adenylate/guanylate cyclase domain-containing protein [Smithellaceae bacterium]
MKCPKCQFENIEGKKFCGGCGSKLEIFCPSCRSSNPPDYKFCDECGHALGVPAKTTPKELTFDEKFQKIQKYLPGGLTEKILAQRGKIEGERKQVTVLFADMENFTPLVEKLGPEEAYAIMDQVYEILIHKVHDYEGTVNEMTGDGVMALFGAPIALEDAPQRAIRSALSIHQEIARFSDRMKQEKGIPQIKMRIGIHTGPVVVGTLGNDLRVEFKAVGDTVNLSSRIQNLAAAGTTYVSENTFKLTEGLFRFEALGEKAIKGKEQPVRIYQVIAPSSSRTRFDVSAERGLTPFVGRVRELENLLDGLDRAKTGRGQAFSLIGEAGVGKSRLLYEFHKTVTNEDVTFLEGKCLSYGRGTAYHPIIDILKSTFNINEADADPKIKEKVTNGLKTFKIDVASSLPYLLELLSVKESGIEKIQMSPEGKKDRLLEIMKQILLKGSEIRPLIIAIEDLHWVDKSTEDGLKYFLESIPGVKILLIFTYRPEYVHTWGRKSFHNQLTLNRLSNRESLAMAGSLLNHAGLDRELEELILSRTEGIPFFIEEHIKVLKDLKIIEKQHDVYKLTESTKTLTIPSTIQDVIMARVDALPEGAKEIIRTASVIEREFSHELMKKVAGLTEQELLSNLSFLKDAELIYERGIYPDLTYIFKHALTREVVYDSILSRKKKQIHEKIAETIEDVHRDDLCYHYGVLSGHCHAGENYEKGAEYARLEARRLQKAASFRDAIEYSKKSISCLERLSPTEENQKKLIDVRTTLANYYLSLNLHAQARDAVEPIRDLALKLNYRKKLPAIYMATGLYYIYVEENSRKGLELINRATKMAEESSDHFLWWTGLYISSTFLPFISEFQDAHKNLNRLLDVSLMMKDSTGTAYAKGSISICHQLEGQMTPAYEFARESLMLAKETGDAFIKGMAYPAYGAACYQKGLFDEAKTHLLEFTSSYEKAGPISWMGWAHSFLASIYMDSKAYDAAVDVYEKTIPIFKSAGFLPSIIKNIQSGLIRAKVLRHDQDIALNELTSCYEKYNLTLLKGMTARNMGDALLNLDDNHREDAGMWFQKAIEEDSKNGMMWELAMDHAFYANWFKKKGDIQGAKEQLTKSIDIFRECGADGWVTRTEQELVSLT